MIKLTADDIHLIIAVVIFAIAFFVGRNYKDGTEGLL